MGVFGYIFSAKTRLNAETGLKRPERFRLVENATDAKILTEQGRVV